jgi:hypothetical protein
VAEVAVAAVAAKQATKAKVTEKVVAAAAAVAK